MGESAILFKNVSRHFGEVKAVDNIELEIKDGEFFSMLGPSGSGKTTCLRMIAGFDRPTSGQICLYGQDVSNLPPYERSVNTVFQDYVLFPPSLIERWARLRNAAPPARAISYMRRVPQVSCIFFVMNGAAALIPAL